jgi:adenine-specific DNA glycosylase
MNPLNALNILIPLVVFGYALWLLIRAVQNRKKGKCSLGGCAGCPLEGGCRIAERMKEAEKRKKKENFHE